MDDYSTVAIIDNMVEAQLLDSILTQKEIPHRMQSYQDPAHAEAAKGKKEWGCITAPENYHKIIIYLISDLRKDASHPGDPVR